MASKKLMILAAVSMLFSEHAFSQAHLSEAEVQDFFRLIKSTEQYRKIKSHADSINKAKKVDVEEIKTQICTDKNAPADENIACAIVNVRLLGMLTMPTIYYYYNKRTRRLVTAE